MKYQKLILLGIGVTLSTSIFATQDKIAAITNAAHAKQLVGSDGGHSMPTFIWHCPAPRSIDYSKSVWAAADWESDTYYPKLQQRPDIKFLEVRIISSNDPKSKTTEDVTCIYKINTWHEILIMKPTMSGRTFTDLAGTNWMSVTRPGNGHNEWRCTESTDKCYFFTGEWT